MPEDKESEKSQEQEQEKEKEQAEDEEMPEVVNDHMKQQMRFSVMAKDAMQMNKKGPQSLTAPNLLRRFKINLRLISQSHKNKVCTRLQEVDRLYVCRKTKEQRNRMGKEFQEMKLTDVYIKSNPNKITQKYGQEFIISVDLSKSGDDYRKIEANPEYKAPEEKPEEDAEEEKLLDEQKIFQSLHEALEEMKKKYSKTTEFISELFVRVCGDLKLVEAALQGKEVPQWTYLEDLALTKPMDTQEYQWLLKSKGQKEILKRRKFLLTADSPEESSTGMMVDDRRELEEEDMMHDPNIDESVPYF